MKLTVRLGNSTFDGDSPNGEYVRDAYAKWLDALPRPLPPTADDELARALFRTHAEWYGEDDPADDLGTRLARTARAFFSEPAPTDAAIAEFERQLRAQNTSTGVGEKLDGRELRHVAPDPSSVESPAPTSGRPPFRSARRECFDTLRSAGLPAAEGFVRAAPDAPAREWTEEQRRAASIVYRAALAEDTSATGYPLGAWNSDPACAAIARVAPAFVEPIAVPRGYLVKLSAFDASSTTAAKVTEAVDAEWIKALRARGLRVAAEGSAAT